MPKAASEVGTSQAASTMSIITDGKRKCTSSDSVTWTREAKKKYMQTVGFEPTHLSIMVKKFDKLKTTALDHSAISAFEYG